MPKKRGFGKKAGIDLTLKAIIKYTLIGLAFFIIFYIVVKIILPMMEIM